MSEPQQNVPVEEKTEDKSGGIEGTFRSIEHTLGRFRTEITRLQAQLKSLEKGVNREVKGLKREAVKGKNRGNRQPSGFAKPSAISNELCDFMEKEHGSLVARTEVTRHIIQYIKENGLNDSRSPTRLGQLLESGDDRAFLTQALELLGRDGDLVRTYSFDPGRFVDR